MTVMEKNEELAFIKSYNFGTRRHSSKLLGHQSKTEKISDVFHVVPLRSR